jgi:glycine/D-amino acid oxidase-like deaminating enzyme/nitrite reductase/ring-hydroxylating ferredoxin subunit
MYMARRTSSYAETLPYWSDSASLPTFRALDRDLTKDVVIVGAGITGLTTAYLLAEEGRSVALLERDRCGVIDTGHTTAHLTMVTDTSLNDLVLRFGRSHAQAAWDAGRAAIAQIDDIVQTHGIDCHYNWVDGYRHSPVGRPTRADEDHFKAEAALAEDLGFDATFVETVPFVGGPGIRFDDQAHFHPRKYMAGLITAFLDRGGEIFERTTADEFSDAPLTVKANRYSIRCQDVVIATHNPLVGNASLTGATLFQTKLALYTSYVIAGRVPHGAVADALYWDTADPYTYLRIEPDSTEDVVIMGGEDHKTGQVVETGACYQRLERALTERVPGISLSGRWSGQVIETPDGLPYIGRMAPHQYAATGFSGNGMTFGTLAAVMLSDAILGRQNPWTDLFHPGRKALTRGVWDYIKENVDYPYYMVRDRLVGPEARSLRSVHRGEGKIVERKGKKVAAYRSDRGTLTLRSATCTHMGCLVAWNRAERTWDCPCHGSRFTPTGEVISGPAESALPPAD